MAQVVPIASFFLGKMIYSEKLDCGSNSRLVLSGYMVDEYVGYGQVCISECKVLFILQEIVPVSKGNVAPCWFFLYCSTK